MTATITSPQSRQISTFGTMAIEKVLEALELSKEEAQHVIENGDEFTEAMRTTAEQTIQRLRTPADFASEEVDSSYGYLSGYQPLGLTKQANLLRKAFTGLGYVNLDYQAKIEKDEIKLPKHAEGWFCVPNWIKSSEAGSGSAGHPKLFGETYSSAVKKILEVLKQTRNGKFYNWREGEINEAHLRQSARTKAYFQKLSDAQGNPDIMIVPSQFGICHRGKSVRRARAVFQSNECGLGAFAIGCMLLTHPNRLAQLDDLWIDCAGDEFAPEADGQFVSAPCFSFRGGRLGFGTSDVDDASPSCGSASALLPE
jgi:hypothetical protein